jgi:hypothetical protein
MLKDEIIQRLERIAKHAVHIKWEEPYVMSLDDGVAILDAINMIKSKDTVETRADCVSRQSAIDELDKGAWGAEWDKALAQAMIESLPSAQPERKEGYWLIKQDQNGSTYGECSRCHSIQYAGHTPYCPYCGSHNGGNG